MKKKKTFIWFLVIAVLLAGTYVIVSLTNPKEKEEDRILLATLAKDAMNKIVVEKEGKTYTFYADESNVWKLAEDSDYPLNQSKAEDMLDAVSYVEAYRIVTEDRSGFATYGLDPPKTVISAYDKNGNKAVYNLGILNEVTSGYYVNIEGTEQVYIVNPSFGEAFSLSLNEMAMKEKMASYEPETMTGLTLKNGQESFTLREREENDTFHSAFYAWFIEVSGKDEVVPADTNKAPDYLTLVYNNVFPGAIENYKATDQELAIYGLDEASTVKLTILYDETDTQTGLTADKKAEFYFGKKNRRYGKRFYLHPYGRIKNGLFDEQCHG